MITIFWFPSPSEQILVFYLQWAFIGIFIALASVVKVFSCLN